jgi:hypothetical protein
MNEIVRKHYPASRLPADLREGIPADSQVLVTIVVEEPRRRFPTQAGEGVFSRFSALRRSHFTTTADVVEHVRALRDE